MLYSSFILDDFKKYEIDLKNTILVPNTECPQSCVIISKETGSRTIIHSNKNLPELTMDNFKNIDLSLYKWIHFEVRENLLF